MEAGVLRGFRRVGLRSGLGWALVDLFAGDDVARQVAAIDDRCAARLAGCHRRGHIFLQLIERILVALPHLRIDLIQSLVQILHSRLGSFDLLDLLVVGFDPGRRGQSSHNTSMAGAVWRWRAQGVRRSICAMSEVAVEAAIEARVRRASGQQQD